MCRSHKFKSLLDLGCGTGLMGASLKNDVSEMTGLDLSVQMLDGARKKNVYNSLINDEIRQFLEKSELDYDLIVAADVFIYLGEVSSVFELLSKRNKVSSIFAFSTEHIEGTGFKIEMSGRFSHSKKYIEEVAKSNNFEILDFLFLIFARKEIK